MAPQTFYGCAILIVFFGVIGTMDGSAWERNYPSTAFLGPIFIGSFLLPVYVGVKIYVKLFAPYVLASSGREYSGVSPTAKTLEYADAGIIKFTKDASLYTSRAFGFKDTDFTYCVAPVVSRHEPVHPHSSGPKISFWAVGKDCCGNRRDFECDGAGDMDVRSAFTVRDIYHDHVTRLLVPRTSRPQYLKAVEAAKALHHLRSENDDEIILLRWAAEPEKTLNVWYLRGLLSVLLSCFIFGVLITVIWTSIHCYFDMKVRELAGAASGARQVPPSKNSPFALHGNV